MKSGHDATASESAPPMASRDEVEPHEVVQDADAQQAEPPPVILAPAPIVSDRTTAARPVADSESRRSKWYDYYSHTGASSASWWASRSTDDLAEYRNHYPAAVNDESQRKNVLFYRNELRMVPDNVFIDEALTKWAGDNDLLETGHSYIQWLFPIQEHGLNPRAQPLMKHEIATMVADRTIMDRVHRTFDLMLDFYGMVRSADTFSRAEHFAQAFYNLNHSSHNYLRITRILKFLGEVGLEHLKVAWLRALALEIFGSTLLANCRRSFEDYWIGTVYSDEQRKQLKEAVAAIPANPETERHYKVYGSERWASYYGAGSVGYYGAFGGSKGGSSWWR